MSREIVRVINMYFPQRGGWPDINETTMMQTYEQFKLPINLFEVDNAPLWSDYTKFPLFPPAAPDTVIQ